jgi:TolB protein
MTADGGEQMSMLRSWPTRLRWLLLLLVAGLLLWLVYGLWWRPRMAAGDTPPPLLYIGPDARGAPQLFHATVREGDTTLSQLTTLEGVTLRDFAIAPQNGAVALAVEGASGGAILLLSELDGEEEIQELLVCPQAECLSPVWAADGRRLIYERRELSSGDGVAGLSHLWWLDTTTGETIPVLQDNDRPAHGACFSPDGQWLSYVAPAEAGVEVYNLVDGRHFLLPSRVGAAAAWSTDGRTLLISDLKLITVHGAEGDDHLTHNHEAEEGILLYAIELGAGTFAGDRRQLSPEAGVDDGSAAWSPDGQWIAFGRKLARAQSGRQLWLMRADGSEAHALTNEPAIQHGPPQWSPDGRYLLFQRYPLAASGASPEVWMLHVESGEMQQVAAHGYLPRWLAE